MKKIAVAVLVVIASIAAFTYADRKENMITVKVGKIPTSVEVADLNNDRIPDIVVANGGDSSVTILLGRAGGVFMKRKALLFMPAVLRMMWQ